MDPDELQPVIVTAKDVRPEKVRWLWPRRIPLAKVTVLDGDPDLGKSTFTIDLAARVSTHSPMPDGATGEADARGVLIVNGEDGLADTMVPRLAAAAADMASVHFLDAVPYVTEEGKILQRPVSVPADLLVVERAIKDYVIAVVVIDPLAAFLDESINTYRDSDVRRALFPLSRLAERSGAAIVLVRHLNKSPAGNPLYRGGGSIGIIGAARSGLLIAIDPKDENRRVLAVTKSNLSSKPPAMAFHLFADELHDCARIAWDGTVQFKAADLLNGPVTEPTPTPEASGAMAIALNFLDQVLGEAGSEGRWVKEILDDAHAAGINKFTVRRAKDIRGVVVFKVGARQSKVQGWRWRLPGAAPKVSKNPEGERGPGRERAAQGEGEQGRLISPDTDHVRDENAPE